MNWFNRLMQRRKDIESSSLMNKTNGEIITELTGGRFLVHGKPVYELALEYKNDIEIMLLCCESELEKMCRKYSLLPQTHKIIFIFDRDVPKHLKTMGYELWHKKTLKH